MLFGLTGPKTKRSRVGLGGPRIKYNICMFSEMLSKLLKSSNVLKYYILESIQCYCQADREEEAKLIKIA